MAALQPREAGPKIGNGALPHPMQVVNFTFRQEATRQSREAALASVSTWPEVWKVRQLGAEDEAVDRLAYLYLKDGQDAQAVIRRLEDLPEVESAATPAQRRLIR